MVFSLINDVLIEDTGYGLQWPHLHAAQLPPNIRIKTTVLVDFAPGQALGE